MYHTIKYKGSYIHIRTQEYQCSPTIETITVQITNIDKPFEVQSLHAAKLAITKFIKLTGVSK